MAPWWGKFGHFEIEDYMLIYWLEVGNPETHIFSNAKNHLNVVDAHSSARGYLGIRATYFLAVLQVWFYMFKYWYGLISIT